MTDSDSETEIDSIFGHESDNEPDADPEEFVDEPEDLVLDNLDIVINDVVNNIVKGGDGTEWSFEPIQYGRRKSINIITNKPGLTRISSKAKSVLEVFELLISSEILNIIVTETNRKAEHCCQIENKVWKKTDLVEIQGFIGLLYLSGVFRDRKDSIKNLWSKNKFGQNRPFYSATMSRNRFIELSKYMRFDNYETRQQRVEFDKLASIRNVIGNYFYFILY